MYSSGPNVAGPQRRFGNAFTGLVNDPACTNDPKKVCDRRFLIRGDAGEDKEDVFEAARARCARDRFCAGVFVWKQSSHALVGSPPGNGVKESRYEQASLESFAAVGLSLGDGDGGGLFGNYFSYETMFLRGSNSTDGVALEEVPFPFLLDTESTSLEGKEVNVNLDLNKRRAFESESWIKETTCPESECTYYSGACVHRATGFCMDEVPGTSKCLDSSFSHCNNPRTLNY